MSTAMVVQEPDDGEVHLPVEANPPRTDAAQARVDSVARVLDVAYQKASTLELTEEEIKKLLATFPDDAIRPGADGKPEMLYLEHAYIRDRLFSVFGPGRWALICRRLWSEEFFTNKGGKACRVYGDCVLIVRGCYVGEAIGTGIYYLNNASSDYSDAAESAQSTALRRIAGKYLGIGLQLWQKEFTDGWKQRRANGKQKPAPAHIEVDEPCIGPEDAENLNALIKQHQTKGFGRAFNIERLGVLPASKYEEAKRWILDNSNAAPEPSKPEPAKETPASPVLGQDQMALADMLDDIRTGIKQATNHTDLQAGPGKMMVDHKDFLGLEYPTLFSEYQARYQELAKKQPKKTAAAT